MDYLSWSPSRWPADSRRPDNSVSIRVHMCTHTPISNSVERGLDPEITFYLTDLSVWQAKCLLSKSVLLMALGVIFLPEAPGLSPPVAQDGTWASVAWLSLGLLILWGYLCTKWGFPGGANGKEISCQCRRCKRCMFYLQVRKISWRRKRQPTPVFLLWKSHGQRSLVGYSPQGCKESDTTELI